ncbi:MAG: hypothetical protein WCO96_04210 [Actinomycetes bacterium]
MAGGAYLVLALFCGLGGALIAHAKGNPRFIWFLIAFLLPFAGLIAALVARSEASEPLRRCDLCGKPMPVSETLCTRCGTDLDYPEELLPSRRELWQRQQG